MQQIWHWVRYYVVNVHILLQIVHLVRDPRGMFSSLSAKPDIWNGILGNLEKQCQTIAEDVSLSKRLGVGRWALESIKYVTFRKVTLRHIVQFSLSEKELWIRHSPWCYIWPVLLKSTPPFYYFCRYFRVHYEDLVDNTISTLESIYTFMGVPFGKDERKFAYEHTHEDPVKNPYFSTFRGSDFSHDSWKTKLKPEVK